MQVVSTVDGLLRSANAVKTHAVYFGNLSPTLCILEICQVAAHAAKITLRISLNRRIYKSNV